jgi:hypothetical protein
MKTTQVVALAVAGLIAAAPALAAPRKAYSTAQKAALSFAAYKMNRNADVLDASKETNGRAVTAADLVAKQVKGKSLRFSVSNKTVWDWMGGDGALNASLRVTVKKVKGGFIADPKSRAQVQAKGESFPD